MTLQAVELPPARLALPRDPAVQFALLVLAYVAFWTVYAVLSRNNLSSTPNMVENWVWGREWQWGYYKHPPLFAWVTAAWFELFPRTDWAYFLLASLVPAVGLAGAWMAIGVVERGPKRLLAVAALLLSPLYGFHALRFNANTMLIAVWPWAVWAFLEATRRPTLARGAVLGLTLALGMLAKYYTFVLVLGMVAAVLADPARRRLALSPAALAATATGLALFAPHLAWMVATDFQTLTYAGHARSTDASVVARSIGEFVAADLLFQLPILLGILLVLPAGRLRAVADGLFTLPADPDRRRLFVLATVPFAATLVLAAALRSGLSALWGMPLWLFTGWVLLSSPKISDTALAPRRLVVPLAVAALGLILAAPVIDEVSARLGTPDAVDPAAEIAALAEATWHREVGDRRLAIVAGDELIAGSVAFYAPDDPSELIDFDFAKSPWIDAARLDRDGALAVCRGEDRRCIDAARKALGPDLVETDHVVAKHWHGRDLTPKTVHLVLRRPAPSTAAATVSAPAG